MLELNRLWSVDYLLLKIAETEHFDSKCFFTRCHIDWWFIKFIRQILSLYLLTSIIFGSDTKTSVSFNKCILNTLPQSLKPFRTVCQITGGDLLMKCCTWPRTKYSFGPGTGRRILLFLFVASTTGSSKQDNNTKRPTIMDSISEEHGINWQ